MRKSWKNRRQNKNRKNRCKNFKEDKAFNTW